MILLSSHKRYNGAIAELEPHTNIKKSRRQGHYMVYHTSPKYVEITEQAELILIKSMSINEGIVVRNRRILSEIINVEVNPDLSIIDSLAATP